jgi:AcrR family transcriptional regulator
MKTDTRTYTMGARADAVDATRERIARAALARFIADSYDAVTIASVAKDAGVSHQTVLNHFASKEGLFTAAAERFGADVVKLRGERTGQDAASAVALAIEQYEATGDGNVRLAMLDDRIPAVKAAMDVGRATHQAWLAEVFADELPSGAAERAHVLSQLHAATDVYTWKLLRRDRGLSPARTRSRMLTLLRAVLAAPAG